MSTPLERARGLREAAREDPSGVNPDHVIELLRYPRRPVQREAAEALLSLVTEHPSAGAPAVGRIAYLLRSVDVETAEDPETAVVFAETLLLSLARIASEVSEKALTARGEVLACLAPPDGPLAAAASVCIVQFVETGPASFVSHVATFEALLHADSAAVRRNAAHILTELAESHPDAVAVAVSSLGEGLADPDPETAKKSAMALGLVARSTGGSMGDTVPALVATLDAEERGLRANAAGALADVAQRLPDAVAEHEAALRAVLHDDAAAVRRNTAVALARLAAAGVGFDEETRTGLVDRLDDPDATVRATACLALGHVDSPVVRELLRRTAENDDSPAVRQAAERALERA